MGSFMADNTCNCNHPLQALISFKEVVIGEGDQAGVFHGSSRILVAEDAVVLGERILNTQFGGVELDGQFSELEEEICVFCQLIFIGIQGVYGHWDVLS